MASTSRAPGSWAARLSLGRPAGHDPHPARAPPRQLQSPGVPEGRGRLRARRAKAQHAAPPVDDHRTPPGVPLEGPGVLDRPSWTTMSAGAAWRTISSAIGFTARWVATRPSALAALGSSSISVATVAYVATVPGRSPPTPPGRSHRRRQRQRGGAHRAAGRPTTAAGAAVRRARSSCGWRHRSRRSTPVMNAEPSVVRGQHRRPRRARRTAARAPRPARGRWPRASRARRGARWPDTAGSP